MKKFTHRGYTIKSTPIGFSVYAPGNDSFLESFDSLKEARAFVEKLSVAWETNDRLTAAARATIANDDLGREFHGI